MCLIVAFADRRITVELTPEMSSCELVEIVKIESKIE